MQHNILITSAGERVVLTRYFKETLNRSFPNAKVFTTDMNPQMAPAGYVSNGCFQVPRVTDKDMVGSNFPELLIREYFLGEKVDFFDHWKDGTLMLRYDDAIYV